MIELPVGAAALAVLLILLAGMAIGGRMTAAILKYYSDLTGAGDGSRFDYKDKEERRLMNGDEIKEFENHQG